MMYGKEQKTSWKATFWADGEMCIQIQWRSGWWRDGPPRAEIRRGGKIGVITAKWGDEVAAGISWLLWATELHCTRAPITRVASLCKEMNLQGNANGRKVVVFVKVRNLQGTENARKDKLESARKGNCKEWNLQEIEFASKGYIQC